MITPLKRFVRASINRLGYDVTRIPTLQPDPKCEGFDRYLAAAQKAGLDVNDWIETVLKWEPALPILTELVFPYLHDNSCVCEIGPGTGRHARYIIPRISGGGALHLFDHSTWVQNFLRHYFAVNENVVVHDFDGWMLDMPDNSTDLVFSNGTFIELNLNTILIYSQEFWRICRRRAHVIFDYIDISTEEGWRFLESQPGDCFTYHCGSTIDKVFTDRGFIVVKRLQVGKSTYVVFTKE